MAKTAQKKKQTIAPPPRLSTRANNANAHPGLVDISEESDPERAKRNTKRKAVRLKAKEDKIQKEANVVEMEQLISKLQSEIARRDAQGVVSKQADSEAQLAAPSSPVEEAEDPPVPPSSPIEEILDDPDVEMSNGGVNNKIADLEGSQSPSGSESDDAKLDFDMEGEETLGEIERPAAAATPGGPLRRVSIH